MRNEKRNNEHKRVNNRSNEFVQNTQNKKERSKQIITVDVKDQQLNTVQKFQMTLTHHSSERMTQRNITSEALEIALIYGKTFFKQGFIFYVLGEKNLPERLNAQLRKKCKNLVIVVSGDSDEIVTSYRSKNPFKHIKKKTKRLSRYTAAA